VKKNIKSFLLVLAALVPASVVFAQTWTQTSAPGGASAIACSADGSTVVAVAGNSIYVSTNAGVTWASTNLPSVGLKCVASSADGTRLVTASLYANSTSGIFISTNSGVDWQSTSTPGIYWNAIASSADGTKLVAIGSSIYTSTNSGVTWISNSAPSLNLLAAASSADGTKLIAIGSGQPAIYISTNSGATWASSSASSNFYGRSVTSSSDGTKLVLVGDAEAAVHLSTDSGATWVSNSTPGLYWQGVALSADGTKLVAVSNSGWIYTSTNSGVTLTSNSVPSGYWSSVASSADGSKLVAAIDPFSFIGNARGIYVSHTTPVPSLNIAPSDTALALSWTIPSTNFVLQQSSDLTSWADVTNAPVLNLTNLQNEVTLSPSNSSSFYRLKTP
jgi:hypothetical protein